MRSLPVQLSASRSQLDVQLGKADVVTKRQPDADTVDPDDHGLMSGGDGVGLGEAECVVEVDLVVVGLDAGAIGGRSRRAR